MADPTVAAQLAALKIARNSGVLIVRHGETSTTYRSLAEIDSIIARLTADVAAETTPKKRIRYLYQSGKGL